MAHILLVDDDETILKMLQSSLSYHAFEVSLSQNGRDAIRMVYQEQPDLIIIDILMPEMNGIELCKRLRDMTDVPIIALSALSGEGTIVTALEAGADDYVVKPYSIAELLARIHAQLRIRATVGAAQKASPFLTAGVVKIDVLLRTVTVQDKAVNLTPIEYALLLCLVRNRDRVVDHRKLLLEAWGPEYVDQLEYLRLYVRYLRQKIEEDPANPQIIKTQRGVGYYISTYIGD